MVGRRTSNREVAGSSLTHCTAYYGHGLAAHAHVPLSLSSIICKDSDVSKQGNSRSGVTAHFVAYPPTGPVAYEWEMRILRSYIQGGPKK